MVSGWGRCLNPDCPDRDSDNDPYQGVTSWDIEGFGLRLAEAKEQTMTYQRFNEIITEMKARPDTDPAVILAEHVGPLVDICEGINDWLRDNREWDLRNEPPWYNAFVCEIARFSVDLSPIWQEYRAEAASLD